MIQIREALSYERSQFAELLGVDYDTIWRWETGRRKMSLSLNQIKILDDCLSNLGLRFSNLPDDVGPPK